MKCCSSYFGTSTSTKQQSYKMKNIHRILPLAIAASLTLLSGSASAAVFFTDWTTAVDNTGGAGSVSGTAAGTLTYPGGSSTVTFAGDVYSAQSALSGTSSFFNNPAFASPGQIALTDGIATEGAGPGFLSLTNTLTFSPALVNPILYFGSLGDGSPAQITQNYTFTSPFTLLTPSSASMSSPSANVLRGLEGYGAIQFSGSVSQIQWTASTYERYAQFQVAVVPEPTSGILAAMAGGCFLLRRRRNA
jgi:hypothetical protein